MPSEIISHEHETKSVTFTEERATGWRIHMVQPRGQNESAWGI